jgi:hypothetical protein
MGEETEGNKIGRNERKKERKKEGRGARIFHGQFHARNRLSVFFKL